MRAMCIAIVLIAGSGMAMGAIANSAHDFSGDLWSGGEICLPCHAPHNPDPGGTFLWNHAVPSEASLTEYTPASGAAVNLGNASLGCLGCHDGVTALDSFGGATGTALMTGTSVIGQDLTDDHPVGVAFPGTSDYKAGHTLPLYDNGGTDQVECASCHDVHNNGGGSTNMLRMDNTGSALCIDCHNK